ncbi:MAG TPA: glycosyl transferase family 1 [Micrococcales bacterium]|nr:glycosyl transferase family 1 [Micrococcales bacterium]
MVGSRTVVVAHPSPDLYGSDLQLLETVTAFVDDGWDVMVVLPKDGPLEHLLRQRGARVIVAPFPVVSRSLFRPQELLRFVLRSAQALVRAHQLLRKVRPAAVWVNTLTVPVWLAAAASMSRTPSVIHVHEAEEDAPRAIRLALTLPTLLARAVVVNSRAAGRALTDVLPVVRARLTLVYNGVPQSEEGPGSPPAPHGGAHRLALVGRLSPRKGTDLALDAVAILRAQGFEVHLDLFGAVFPGYEWYEDDLRERASRPDLRGAVTFHGYVRPVSLAMADVVLVPSRVEPFGNVAVEAQLAWRPLVVSAVQGLTEIVDDRVTGLHFRPGSPEDLARAVAQLLEDRDLARRLAVAGHDRAVSSFSVARYHAGIARVLRGAATRPTRASGNGARDDS